MALSIDVRARLDVEHLEHKRNPVACIGCGHNVRRRNRKREVCDACYFAGVRKPKPERRRRAPSKAAPVLLRGLRRVIADSGLTQREVSIRAGISRATVSDCVSLRTGASEGTRNKLARALRVTEDELKGVG